jgi:hypothetical protein
MSFTPRFNPDPKPEKQEKKKRKRIQRSYIKVRYKPTGEKKVFEEIWNEREHVCTNCDAHLGDEMLTVFFAHLIPKGRDNKKRLDKTNITLHCFICHQLRDQGTMKQYKRAKLSHTGINRFDYT